MGIGAIRYLCALGLIKGQETGEELRYSKEEVIQLRRIRQLQHDLGNLTGVEVILRLLKHLEVVHQSRRKIEQRETIMNIEQFTDKAREALRVAAERATERHHTAVRGSIDL